MKILVDTNVLISALVFGGKSKLLLVELFKSEHTLYVSSYIDEEFNEKLLEKWSDKAERIYNIYRKMDFIHVDSTNMKLGDLRDKKDIPILSDAIHHGMDVILTGDKDFLEADLEKPLALSVDILYQYLNEKQ